MAEGVADGKVPTKEVIAGILLGGAALLCKVDVVTPLELGSAFLLVAALEDSSFFEASFFVVVGFAGTKTLFLIRLGGFRHRLLFIYLSVPDLVGSSLLFK